MCGIVGAASSAKMTVNSDEAKYFRQALFADTLRGVDSTGIALWDMQAGKPQTYKRALAAPDFLQLTKTDKMLSKIGGWNLLLGHNRAATKGGVEDSTSHPFQIGDITLVHNGTVSNHRTLPDGNQFDVDSEAITHAINKEGIEAVVAELRGAFTLVYHDASTDTLNMIRNEERPLAIGICENKKTILFASEPMMLNWLAFRNKLKLTEIVIPKPGELYTYEMDHTKEWAANPTVKKLDLAKPIITNYGNGYVGGTTTSRSTNQTKKPSAAQTGSSRGYAEGRKRLLESVGIKTTNDLIFRATWFDAYDPAKRSAAGDQLGRIVGYVDNLHTNHEVCIHARTQDEFDDVDGMLLCGDISTVLRDNDTQNVLIAIDARTYVSLEDEEAPGTNEEDAPGDNDDDEQETYLGPGGSYYTQEDMADLLGDGCAYCGGEIYLTDAQFVGWTHEGQPVCPVCLKTDSTFLPQVYKH